MSLILRKECQDVLDTFKLQEYHVEINSRKYLSIVTECGRPLVAIFGIKFNKNTPTKEEVLYASDLLNAYLDTHNTKIHEYLNVQKEFNKLLQPADDRFNLTYSERTVKYSDTVIKFEVSLDGRVRPYDLVYPTDSIDMALYKFQFKLAQEAFEFLIACRAYIETRENLSILLEELSACSI